MTLAVPAHGAARLGWLLSVMVFLAGLFTTGLADAKPRKARTVASQKAATVKKSQVAARKSSREPVAVAKRSSSRSKTVVAKARRAAPVLLAPALPLSEQLTANVAYVMDQETGEVVFGKNAEAVQPIASLTKLMSGMVIADADLPMDEKIVITEDDVDRMKFSSSRLRVGTELTRAQALHLSLMSSENRATHALARTYPGGESAFVSAMNVKAKQLGMHHTRYVEPTGLSSSNRSSARDLALLTAAAYDQPLLRRYSTSPGYRLGSLQYVNSNGLVRAGEWDIGLQKTGYIREAGYTLLMQAELAGRKLIMVFLDSASKVSRLKDAERMGAWLKSHPEATTAKKDHSPG